MSRSGRLKRRLAFDERTKVEDGFGNERSDWAERFCVHAGVKALRGGEAVLAARLESRQPVIVTVRKSSQSDRISGAWRARDVRTGEVFNIRTKTMTDDRLYYELMAESGVNAG